MENERQRVRLRNVASLPVGGTVPFAIPGSESTGFAVNTTQGLRAWLNRCDHWPVPLDMDDGDFVSPLSGLVTCKSHGAAYDPASGHCLMGPCRGAQLHAFALEIEGEDAWVDCGDPGSLPKLYP